MLSADIEAFLARGLDRLGLVLDRRNQALERLAVYFQELLKWNRKINLVARSLTGEQILEDHFLDSLSLLLLLEPEQRRHQTLLDIGSGAGFPGLVLKAACPELPVTLVEPRQNRYYFLRHMIRTLDLQGVTVLNVYLEESRSAVELSGRRFSCIASRAFSDIPRFVRLASPYLAPAGRIVMMKGPAVNDELEELAQNGLPGRFRVAGQQKVLLPFAGKERWLVSFTRTG